MKVLHIIDTIARSAGGPSRSCQGLVAALSAEGVECGLMSLTPGERPWAIGGAEYVPFEGMDRLEAQIRVYNPQIVHIHDLWRPCLHSACKICRKIGLPYVVSPRGMLEPWSLRRKWLKKRIARWLYQDRDLKCAAALHATAESEAEQFRKLGFKNRIIISSNGITVPRKFEPRNTQNTRKRVLFVSRMHPKKGVLELVEAWNKIRPKDWKCELVYTVSGDLEKEYEMKVKARVKELGLEDSFIFTGALNDDEKWKAYARADLFVLPTYSENFGIVVAEALYAGLSVITTKGAPWKDLAAEKCGWWIDIGVEPLAEALRLAFATSLEELRQMGARGHELVARKYAWLALARQMKAEYEKLLGW